MENRFDYTKLDSKVIKVKLETKACLTSVSLTESRIKNNGIISNQILAPWKPKNN